MICTKCRVSRDVAEFRWDNAGEGYARKRMRFDDAVRDGRIPDAADCTRTCRTCRGGSSDAPHARRTRECQEWYRSQLTACAECTEETRPECLGLFLMEGEEAVRPLSCTSYWATAARGVDAMRRVRSRFAVYCFFCKSAYHHPPSRDTEPVTAFDQWLDERMRTACGTCGRVATADTLRGFQFAHHDSTTKTVHPTLGPLSMVTLRRAVRSDALAPEEAISLATSEWPRGRVLCHNCHRVETRTRAG